MALRGPHEQRRAEDDGKDERGPKRRPANHAAGGSSKFLHGSPPWKFETKLSRSTCPNSANLKRNAVRFIRSGLDRTFRLTCQSKNARGNPAATPGRLGRADDVAAAPRDE